jgi:hypothetical protein
MSRNSDALQKNNYEGNGWSKYQIMVLQQLEDHNAVLQNLNKELIELKQNMAVSETELKMWRAQTMLSIEKLTEEVDEILYDESGLSYKIRALERNNEVDEKVSLKTKAIWAMLGAILTFLASFGAKVVEIFLK